MTDASQNKRFSKKRVEEVIWEDDSWAIRSGKLIPGPGRPKKTARLFSLVGEKLPFEGLTAIRKHLESDGVLLRGVYLAHDSMGYARYGGRGLIFDRLASHKRKYPAQLIYFSFYTIANKAHEREIETIILRAAGPQMALNTRKIASSFEPGNIQDYEPGTEFFERLPRGKNSK